MSDSPEKPTHPVEQITDPFRRLVAIMEALRAPDGCPWDQEQTHETLKQYLLEETYETLDAIDAGDMPELRDELGDVLLQVVFHAQLAAERSDFTVDDVAASICDKMIRRHPHIFGNVNVETADEVVTNWEAIKRKERAAKAAVKDTVPPSPFAGVPKTLPALMRAVKLQWKAAKRGFDWPSDEGVLEKLQEELQEIREARKRGDQENLAEEFGDALFLLANLARHWKIEPEQALVGTCKKFTARYELMQRLAADDGVDLESLDLDGQDRYWDRAKAMLRAM